MSRLQLSAKPIIVDFLTLGKLDLSAMSRQTLGAWAAMFSMVYERAEPLLANSTVIERTTLMQQLTMPEGWRLYVARADIAKEVLGAWRRSGHKISGEPLHVTIINFEKWVFVETNIPVSSDAFDNFVQIWPELERTMALGSIIQQRDVIGLADKLIAYRA